MACSKYQYVKKFQESRNALLETYIVVRVDGRAFTNFCAEHQFEKPNDIRAVRLMNEAAMFVCSNFTDIFLAYGQSDEYSFALNKNTILFNRRTDKILSTIVSAFSSAYVFNWSKFFNFPMKSIPTFDSRVVVYPNQKCLKDYFRWRQVDCHINNLYNTIFWLMVKTGKSNTEVEKILKDTNSGQKNQILFSQFNVNYNTLPDAQKKGNIICYKKILSQDTKAEQTVQPQHLESVKEEQCQVKVESQNLLQDVKEENPQKENAKFGKKEKKKDKFERAIVHEDLIKQGFWESIKF